MALGFPGHMAGGLASSPLRMMGGSGSPSASGGNFFSRNGMGAGFSDFAQGIRGITSNFAAGFGQDPYRRAQAQQTAQGIEQQQADSRRQILEMTFGNLETLAAGLQGLGTIPPSLQAYLDKSYANLANMGVDPAIIEETKSYLQAVATMPAEATEPDYQNVIGPDGQPMGTVNVNDQQAVAGLPQGWRLGGAASSPEQVLPPDVEAQRVRIAHASRPPRAESASDAQSREIQRLIDVGVDPDMAVKAAAGVLAITSPDQFGNVSIVDKSTGQAISTFNMDEMNRGGGDQLAGGGDVATTPDQPHIPPLSEDMPKATGALSGAKAVVSGTIGQVVPGQMFPDTMEARNRVQLFERTAQEALVNNDRFPQGEQAMVRTMIPAAGEWFSDPDDAQKKVETLQNYLTQKKTAINKSLSNARLSRDTRATLTDQLAAVDRTLQMMQGMGTPPASASGGGDIPEDLLTKPAAQWTDEDIKRANKALGQ